MIQIFCFLIPLLLQLYLSIQSLAIERPNVLFLLADDLGFADLDWRDPALITPNLRQLAFAADSALLDHVYVGPLCTPSVRGNGNRRLALTEQNKSGPVQWALPLQDGHPGRMVCFCMPMPVAFPQQSPFSRKCSAALAIALTSWANGTWAIVAPSCFPLIVALTHFTANTGHKPGISIIPPILWTIERTLAKAFFCVDLICFGSVTANPCRTGAAREVLSTANGTAQNPFFLMFAFQAVHAPLEVPPEWVALCPTHLPENRRLYCGMLAGLDWAVGRLLAHLRATGQYNRTLIVFGTDNGGDPEFGASNWPLRGGKGSLWEGGTRSTAIVHWVGHVRGGTRHDLFHAVDWPATLLGAAGLGLGRFGDGFNQWQMLSRRVSGLRGEVLYGAQQANGKGQAAIRDRHWKLLLHPPAPAALFRIDKDPVEMRDLARQFPAEVRRLKARLARLTTGPRLANAFMMRTDPRGWPQRHGGAFAGGWC